MKQFEDIRYPGIRAIRWENRSCIKVASNDNPLTEATYANVMELPGQPIYIYKAKP